MTDHPPAFPPGWYPDPTGRHDHRWYDGARWTDHVGDGGRAGMDALEASPSSGAPRDRPRRDAVRVLATLLGGIAVAVVAFLVWAVWMLTSGRGPAGDAFERYRDCLESREPAECEAELERLLIERLTPGAPPTEPAG